jgi:hypothetical protein
MVTGAFWRAPVVGGTLHLSGGRTTEAKPVSTDTPTTGWGTVLAGMRWGGIGVLENVDSESTFYVAGSYSIIYSHPVATTFPAEGVPTPSSTRFGTSAGGVSRSSGTSARGLWGIRLPPKPIHFRYAAQEEP